MDPEDIETRLTAEQIDVLRASLICGMSLNNYCSRDTIETQIFEETRVNLKNIISSLIIFNPPLIEGWEEEESYHFTVWGAEVAKYIIRTPRTTYAKKEIIQEIPKVRIGRGDNNRLMIEYAEQNNCTYVKTEPRRCTYCNHKNEFFIKKGANLICQICFSRGKRF